MSTTNRYTLLYQAFKQVCEQYASIGEQCKEFIAVAIELGFNAEYATKAFNVYKHQQD